MRKILSGLVGVAFMVTLGIGLKPPVAQAAKVNCAKVMSELDSGKKPKTVAADLKISTSSVYRCKRNSVTSAKSTPATAAASSPMASPSPMH